MVIDSSTFLYVFLKEYSFERSNSDVANKDVAFTNWAINSIVKSSNTV